MKILCAIILAVTLPAGARAQALDPQQVRAYPFPQNLTAAATGSRIAWTFNEEGRRNVYVAEGPGFTARKITAYDRDDGQELTSVSLSSDGQYIVYVRGGEHSSNWDDEVIVNAESLPVPPKLQILSVPFAGGEPKVLNEGGDYPVISPDSRTVAFERERQIWTVPIDGSAAAKRLLSARGNNGDIRWSPDGSRLAFVSSRADHSFIGVYEAEATPILWIAPSTARDASPRWSPDGRRIAFVRRPGAGGAPDMILERRHNPWTIWTGDAMTGEARQIWKAPETLPGSSPSTQGGTNLHWAAGGRIVFVSYMDGWPHIYSVAHQGGEPLLLTPGNYMAEFITMSPDRRHMVFMANAGSDPNDIDRRHVVKVPVDRAAPEVLTPGQGLEFTPVVTGDGRSIVYLGATAQRPPLPMAMAFGGGRAAHKTIAADMLERYPASQLVAPRKVTFRAPDGNVVHGQLFERAGGGRKPAILYVHGGPSRQMLVGWHYSDYYSNAYAMNQYLASRGFVVLAVNYRLGIGYGYDFQNPASGGMRGASEYQDIRAAGEYLRNLASVDGRRIGIYGGSYGGYLTALALAKDSHLFAAGVDIHGVHNYTSDGGRRLGMGTWQYEPTDRDSAAVIAWQSSPVASIGTWKSPVLFIHGDDDRNVRFSETVDLVQRVAAAGIPYEEIVIPDDTHHWMLHRNNLRVNAAVAEFFQRKLMSGN
ncbi:MAG: S9 family peptidase [Gemmatimonadaceae bacterium]